jgi:hypothetical protein
VVLLSQPRECQHSFTSEHIIINGEIKAVAKICTKCGFTTRETV